VLPVCPGGLATVCNPQARCNSATATSRPQVKSTALTSHQTPRLRCAEGMWRRSCRYRAQLAHFFAPRPHLVQHGVVPSWLFCGFAARVATRFKAASLTRAPATSALHRSSTETGGCSWWSSGRRILQALKSRQGRRGSTYDGELARQPGVTTRRSFSQDRNVSEKELHSRPDVGATPTTEPRDSDRGKPQCFQRCRSPTATWIVNLRLTGRSRLRVKFVLTRLLSCFITEPHGSVLSAINRCLVCCVVRPHTSWCPSTTRQSRCIDYAAG
jgi:hypothetical protein